MYERLLIIIRIAEKDKILYARCAFNYIITRKKDRKR